MGDVGAARPGDHGRRVAAASRDGLARLLRPFARVEPGEGGTVLLLMVTLFLLLTSYYLLKTVREPLILVGGGAEVKSYAAAAQAILLLLIVPAYSALVNRVGRVRLINRIGLFFVGNIALFYLLARLHVPYLGVPFFIWVGIFSLMVIAQLWSFANDLYTPEQGKRLFALIAVGSSIGAIAGAWFAGWLLAAGVGVYEMMLVAAAALAWLRRPHGAGPAARTGALRRRLAANRRPHDPARSRARTRASRWSSRDRYLLLIALMLLVLNLVNSTGEYILGRTVRQAAAAALPRRHETQLNAFVGTFYAHYFTVVNALGAVLQLFAVSRIIGKLGVRGAVLVLPAARLGWLCRARGRAGAAADPHRQVRWRTRRTIRCRTPCDTPCSCPRTAEVKYKGKQAVDTFFVRAGDVTSAGVVLAGTTIGLSTSAFALTNAAFVLVWLALAVVVGRRHHALSQAPPAETAQLKMGAQA